MRLFLTFDEIWQTNLVSGIEAANFIHQIAAAFPFSDQEVLRQAAPVSFHFPASVVSFSVLE
jgi:hypothetical protein